MQNSYSVIELILKSFMFSLTGSMPKPELLQKFNYKIQEIIYRQNMY